MKITNKTRNEFVTEHTTYNNKGKSSKRDATATRERILAAGVDEFCEHGYGSARIERITRRADCNIRMIYHYFGSKEGLYLAALEKVYERIRTAEAQLDLEHLDPGTAISRLVEFTYDHMRDHPDFVQLVVNENILRGRVIRESETVPRMSLPLVSTIRDLLARGEAQGQFRHGVDPLQLYISILALSYIHLSNKYTLSITYGQDLGDPEWLAERREHVKTMVLSYLRA